MMKSKIMIAMGIMAFMCVLPLTLCAQQVRTLPRRQMQSEPAQPNPKKEKKTLDKKKEDTKVVQQQTQSKPRPKAKIAKERAAATKKTRSSSDLSVRAENNFPRSFELPEDVVWMREVYRTLDMMKHENGVLYYPVEPMGDRMNLFSLIFKLIASKKINAYEYQLDGLERFNKSNVVQFKDVLDRFGIFYEKKKFADRQDTSFVINAADVPSADVLSYFVKEVWYYDLRTSTYNSVITALCPVLHRSETYSTERVKQPMFWVNYKDLAPYLTGAMVMASNLNNVANRSMDDFFATHQYKGDIYRVTNLQNKSLAEYCKTDTAMALEQKRIENELASFEKHLYGSDTLQVEKQAVKGKKKISKKVKVQEEVEASDSTDVQQPKARNSKKKGRARSSSSSSSSKASKSSSSSSAPRATVRRQRR